MYHHDTSLQISVSMDTVQSSTSLSPLYVYKYILWTLQSSLSKSAWVKIFSILFCFETLEELSPLQTVSGSDFCSLLLPIKASFYMRLDEGWLFMTVSLFCVRGKKMKFPARRQQSNIASWYFSFFVFVLTTPSFFLCFTGTQKLFLNGHYQLLLTLTINIIFSH